MRRDGGMLQRIGSGDTDEDKNDGDFDDNDAGVEVGRLLDADHQNDGDHQNRNQAPPG